MQLYFLSNTKVRHSGKTSNPSFLRQRKQGTVCFNTCKN